MLYNNLPKEKFCTIVLDPAWKITMAGKRNVSRHKRPYNLSYNTLTIKEISSFPVQDLANMGVHIYLWTTNKFLPEAFLVLEKWEVRYHLTMPLVKKSGIVPCNGYVFASEFCLLGFYGKPMLPFKSIGKLNWLQTAPVAGKHSSKPDAFYDLVETMSPGPYLDCFSRKLRTNWISWGDEIV